MDKQKTESDIVFANLTSFGLTDDVLELRCRVCGERIEKTIGATLLGTPVKFGVCKKRSHGASIVKT